MIRLQAQRALQQYQRQGMLPHAVLSKPAQVERLHMARGARHQALQRPVGRGIVCFRKVLHCCLQQRVYRGGMGRLQCRHGSRVRGCRGWGSAVRRCKTPPSPPARLPC